MNIPLASSISKKQKTTKKRSIRDSSGHAVEGELKVKKLKEERK